jgi:hypothetical protein
MSTSTAWSDTVSKIPIYFNEKIETFKINYEFSGIISLSYF